MNNTKKIIIVAVILLGVGLVGSLFTFSNESKDFFTEDKVFESASITGISVTSDNSSIEMTRSSASGIQVELQGNTSRYQWTTDVEGGTLFIDVKTRERRLFQFDFQRESLRLKIAIPEKMFDTIKLDSKNGKIDAANFQAESIQVMTENGRIHLENVAGSTVATSTVNGALELVSLVADHVDIQSTNGRIAMEDVEGQLSGQTSNGSISLITTSLDRPIELSTTNGEITILTEEPPTNAVLDMKSTNGRISFFGASNWDTVIGQGDNLIKLSTKNGRITVE